MRILQRQQGIDVPHRVKPRKLPRRDHQHVRHLADRRVRRPPGVVLGGHRQPRLLERPRYSIRWSGNTVRFGKNGVSSRHSSFATCCVRNTPPGRKIRAISTATIASCRLNTTSKDRRRMASARCSPASPRRPKAVADRGQRCVNVPLFPSVEARPAQHLDNTREDFAPTSTQIDHRLRPRHILPGESDVVPRRFPLVGERRVERRHPQVVEVPAGEGARPLDERDNRRDCMRPTPAGGVKTRN